MKTNVHQQEQFIDRYGHIYSAAVQCPLNAKRDFLKTTCIVGGSEMSRERVHLFCFRHVERLMLPICTVGCLCPNLKNNFIVLCRLPGHNTEGGTQAESAGEQGAEDDISRLRVLENKVLRRIFVPMKD